MAKKKYIMPQFKSEEDEAEYWGEHSPLDMVAEPESQKVKVRGIKDRPITIRLDSDSRLQLEKLADGKGLGPSTFARIILMSVIKDSGQLTTIESLPKPRDTDITKSKETATKEGIATETRASILKSRVKVEEALGRALKNEWKTAIQLLKEAEAIVSGEYYGDVRLGIKMVWLCVQRTSIGPLIAKAEQLVTDWDYQGAVEALEEIISILEVSELPLDYEDYSFRIAHIASVACGTADRWKSDYDSKLDRTLAGVGVMKVRLEEFIEKVAEKKSVYSALME